MIFFCLGMIIMKTMIPPFTAVQNEICRHECTDKMTLIKMDSYTPEKRASSFNLTFNTMMTMTTMNLQTSQLIWERQEKQRSKRNLTALQFTHSYEWNKCETCSSSWAHTSKICLQVVMEAAPTADIRPISATDTRSLLRCSVNSKCPLMEHSNYCWGI